MDAKNGLQMSVRNSFGTLPRRRGTLPKVPWNIQIEGLNEHNLKKKKEKCRKNACRKNARRESASRKHNPKILTRLGACGPGADPSAYGNVLHVALEKGF